MADVLVDWKIDIIIPILKRGKTEDPENYRPVSLTSIPRKVIEQFVLYTLPKH